MSRYISIFAVCFTLAACATGQASTPQTEWEVQQASDHFFDTRQRGDADSFAASFTEDGVYMVPGLSDAAGRSAVQALAETRFAAGARSEDFEIERREVQVFGDSAYELAWFTETTTSHIMKGRHFIVWKREGGDWLVQRYLYSFSGAVPR